MSRSDALWIAFKGIKTSDMGVRVTRLPDVPVAEARGQAVEIPGRDGTLWIGDDSFNDIEMKVEMEFRSEADVSAVAAWLTGEGELVLSDMADYGFRARVVRGFDLERGVFAMGTRRAAVWFRCQPFRYQAGSPVMDPMTQPGVFEGRGTWWTAPAITVYGSGDIDLMVNDATVLLKDVDDHICLDCEAMMAFRDGENASPQVTLMSDDDLWPRLLPGENSVSWSGAVQRVVIEPRWRWR